jgi:hypothetical protein
MTDCSQQRPRGFSTICRPISPERYRQIIDAPALFRQWLDLGGHPPSFDG